jgi:hypothetical protein
MSQKSVVQYVFTHEHQTGVTFQDEYRVFFNRHRGELRRITCLGSAGFLLFLRPYRASHLMGSLPKLKPGLGSLTASR